MNCGTGGLVNHAVNMTSIGLPFSEIHKWIEECCMSILTVIWQFQRFGSFLQFFKEVTSLFFALKIHN